MDTAAQALLAVRTSRERLTEVIDFSRMETDSHGGSWFSSTDSADEHWAAECQRHAQLYDDYHAALTALSASGYPVPEAWWLPEFVPQVSYLSCSAAKKVWMLGTWPLCEPRSPETAVPVGVVFHAGDVVGASYDEAMEVSGVMDESIVLAWEAVRADIEATERRLVEAEMSAPNYGAEPQAMSRLLPELHWVDMAVALLRREPELTDNDAEMARRLGVDRSTVSRNQEYQVLKSRYQEISAGDIPKGRVRVRKDKLQDLEAIDTSGDPAERDWDS